MIEDYTDYAEVDPESRFSISDGVKMPLTPHDIDRIREEAAKIGMRVIVSRSDMEDA